MIHSSCSRKIGTFPIVIFSISGYDGPSDGLLRLKAKSWLEPMDGQDVSAHLVTVSMQLGDTHLIERAPINPIVYIEPPTLWLSGATGTDLWIYSFHSNPTIGFLSFLYFPP